MNYKQRLKHWLGVVFGATVVYQTESFAQEGEDVILAKLVEHIPQGFYIDIGAHHPYRFSNTYLLYKKGWSGINIDPSPGGMSAFQLNRPRDLNLEIGVGKTEGTLTYYQFADTALNTFDPTAAQRVQKSGQSALISKKTVPVQSLQSITDRWVPSPTEVAVLDVDVEGSELEVLQGNDWERIRPLVISVEYLSQEPISAVLESDLAKYLEQYGYELHARTVNTVFFKRSR